MTSLSQYLSTHTIKQVIQEKPTVVVSCFDTSSLPEAMQKLSAHHILSMPVYHETTQDYVGVIGMVEIIKFITDLHWTHLDTPKPEKEALIYVEFNAARVADIMAHKSIKVHDTADFKLAITTLIQSGLHRLPVVDSNGQVVHIISESDVVQFLLDGLSKLDEKYANTQVSSLPHLGPLVNQLSKTPSSDELFVPLSVLRRQDSKLDASELFALEGSRDTVTNSVNGVAKAIEAFRVLLSSNVSAVPIVDSNHVIQSTISIRDIRRIAMNADKISVLYDEDCSTFSQRVFEKGLTEDRIDLEQKQDGLDCKFVTLDDSLGTVIKKLSQNKIFRVWVVDEKKRPISVVTLKHLLNEWLAL